MIRSVINTEDGSNTIYNQTIDECYHSKYGAIAESEHVFIKNGLEKVISDQIRIFELGFGTGLNALLSAIYAQQKHIHIHYFAIEKFPLETEIRKTLNYGCMLNFQDIYTKILDSVWEEDYQISANFILHKINNDIIAYELGECNNIDIVYFDAFSPARQPELWNYQIFSRLFEIVKPGGFLVTYSASGLVKESLRKAGFFVKRRPGPQGKRHMLLAQKLVQ